MAQPFPAPGPGVVVDVVDGVVVDVVATTFGESEEFVGVVTVVELVGADVVEVVGGIVVGGVLVVVDPPPEFPGPPG